MVKKVGILGSTGSIGKQTIEVVKELNACEGAPKFEITALSAGSNAELLAQQARDLNVRFLCIDTEDGAKYLKETLSDMNPYIMVGEKGLLEFARADIDVLVTAIVGMRGLPPTMEAIKCGTEISLANKETLVAAGEIVMAEAKKRGVAIRPVDSEHSAILQCLEGEAHSGVDKLILTASGGPFRTYAKEQLENVTVENALNHPTWNMGGKITIDCASMMNKGLEVIEAGWLFDIPYNDIEVIVHPQSIIHSMVRYRDGSVIAQLGNPTMKLPIQHALTYNTRYPSHVERLDFAKVAQMTFEAPDTDKFPCLKLAYEAGNIGGSLPAVMNMANEKAVEMFFKGSIKFTQIPYIIEKTMNAHKTIVKPTLEEIIDCGKWAYDYAGGLIK